MSNRGVRGSIQKASARAESEIGKRQGIACSIESVIQEYTSQNSNIVVMVSSQNQTEPEYVYNILH